MLRGRAMGPGFRRDDAGLVERVCPTHKANGCIRQPVGFGVCQRALSADGQAGLRRRGWAPAVVRKIVARLSPRRRDRTFPPRSGGPRGLSPEPHAWPPVGSLRPALPKEGGLSPRSRSTEQSSGRFRAGTPAPRREPRPLAARGRPWRFRRPSAPSGASGRPELRQGGRDTRHPILPPRTVRSRSRPARGQWRRG
jgi:hypothetical protein